MDMQSLWRQTSTLPAYAPLEGDREVEALVIGGGAVSRLTTKTGPKFNPKISKHNNQNL